MTERRRGKSPCPHALGSSAAKNATSRSSKAGLEFHVCRITRFLKAGKDVERVGAGAPVYLVAVPEICALELELKGNCDCECGLVFGQVKQLYSENRKEKMELLKGISLGKEDTPNLSTLQQEVLIVWGENDRIFPVQMAHELKEYVSMALFGDF